MFERAFDVANEAGLVEGDADAEPRAEGSFMASGGPGPPGARLHSGHKPRGVDLRCTANTGSLLAATTTDSPSVCQIMLQYDNQHYSVQQPSLGNAKYLLRLKSECVIRIPEYY